MSENPYMKVALLNRGRRRGVAVVYLAILGTVLCGFVSLGVDWAHIQLVKTELQAAADAAARAASVQLPNGVTATQTTAVSWANKNKAGNTSVVIDPTNDVDFGTWNSTNRTFTVLSGAARTSANAVRVWARRTHANGNATSLTFGALVGQSTCDINTSAIVTYVAPQQIGVTGLNSITLSNNGFIGSYNSATNTAPTHATATTSALLQTNGTITGGSDTLDGSINLGPSGSASGLTVTGTTSTLSTPVPAITLPAMTPVTNPGGVSRTPTTSGNVSWPGGTYYFTSFTMGNNDTLTFTGPATIYMDGSVTLGNSCTITPYQSRPGNLVWYQASGTTFTVGNNGATLTGEFIAPGTDFSGMNNVIFYGVMQWKSLDLKNNIDIYMDTSIPPISGGAIGLVK
jgi:Flp pilus assembly protein TadG